MRSPIRFFKVLTFVAVGSTLVTPAWSDPPDLRSTNRELVQSCAEHTPVGVVREVQGRRRPLCIVRPGIRQDYRRNVPLRYRIWRTAENTHIGLNLRLNISSRVLSARAAEMLAKTRSCLPLIREVWARYGILFDLSLDSNLERVNSSPDHEVVLLDAAGRSDSGRYFVRGNTTMEECVGGAPHPSESALRFCENFIRERVCYTILHETGHILGLSDEYPDPACPARPSYVEQALPWSVMNKRALGWESNEFFPRHIEQVMKPLCP